MRLAAATGLRAVSLDAEVQTLRAQVAGLAARVAVLEQQSRRPTDGDLIAVIMTSTQFRAFSASELFAHRVVDDQLRTALESVRATSPRRVGKLLARLAQVRLGTYQLERIGRDEAGIVWAVSAADLHEDAGTRPGEMRQ